MRNYDGRYTEVRLSAIFFLISFYWSATFCREIVIFFKIMFDLAPKKCATLIYSYIRY